jgi:hypothetical protein
VSGRTGAQPERAALRRKKKAGTVERFPAFPRAGIRREAGLQAEPGRPGSATFYRATTRTISRHLFE